MRFLYPIGIEISGVPTHPLDERLPGESYEDLRYRNRSLVETIRVECGNNRTHIDMHCVEVPTPKIYTMASAKRCFLRTRRVMLKYDVHPTHPRVVDGGGHIHVGIPDSVMKQYIARDISRRYYLPWVFSEPDEVESCDNNLGEVDNFYDYCKEHSVILTHLRTVELRFFGAALDWDEQKDHIDFVMAYIKYVKKLYSRGTPPRPAIRNRRELNRITKQEAIAGFRKLLGAIGLPYTRYEKYVKRNLLPRWRDGRRRR